MLTGTEPEHCNDGADAPTALWEILPLADCRIYYLMLSFIAGARVLFDSPTPRVPTGCYQSSAFNGRHTYQNKARLVDPVTVILQCCTSRDVWARAECVKSRLRLFLRRADVLVDGDAIRGLIFAERGGSLSGGWTANPLMLTARVTRGLRTRTERERVRTSFVCHPPRPVHGPSFGIIPGQTGVTQG